MAQARTTAAVLAAAILVACGGGGADSAPPAAAAPVSPTAYPDALPSSGDWFVYTATRTPTLPVDAASTEQTITRHFRVVNADGSLTRTDTSSASLPLASLAFNASGALLSATSASTQCTYAPAFRTGPDTQSVVNDVFAKQTSETCTNPSNQAGLVRTVSVTGSNLPAESRTIALGTFSTFKYAQTTVITSPDRVTTTRETCWIDRISGRTVECTLTYDTVPAGQSGATESGSSRFLLEGYSFRGQTPVGAAVRRFTGYWNVRFADPGTGDCARLLIDINGLVSGHCSFGNVGDGSATTSEVSGTVGADGAIRITATSGARLTGTLTSPQAAQGSWTDSGTSGTWTATHL